MTDGNGPNTFQQKLIYFFRYGNWTGGGYSAGHFSAEGVDYTPEELAVEPVDLFDGFSKTHDIAYNDAQQNRDAILNDPNSTENQRDRALAEFGWAIAEADRAFVTASITVPLPAYDANGAKEPGGYLEGLLWGNAVRAIGVTVLSLSAVYHVLSAVFYTARPAITEAFHDTASAVSDFFDDTIGSALDWLSGTPAGTSGAPDDIAAENPTSFVQPDFSIGRDLLFDGINVQFDTGGFDFFVSIDLNKIFNPSGPGGTIIYGNQTFPTWNYLQPIVVDLDGDGVELLSVQDSNVFLDFDGDGFQERVGWVGADDGILAIDLNADGRINGIDEFAFASSTTADDTDLEALASLYDSNSDGVLDAQDARFTDFRIWWDQNENGISEIGELRTLTEAGITSFDLTSDNQQTDLNGNRINGQSAFTYSDGSTGVIADVALFSTGQGFAVNEDGDRLEIEIENDASILVLRDDGAKQLDAFNEDVDAIVTGGGADHLSASGTGAVLLDAGDGDDILVGGAGDDILFGGSGADRLSGGDGDDTLYIDGEDVALAGSPVSGGDGYDTAHVVGDSAVTLNLTDTSIERAIGGGGADQFTSTDNVDRSFFGGGGDDILQGGQGDDRFEGGAGASPFSGVATVGVGTGAPGFAPSSVATSRTPFTVRCILNFLPAKIVF